MSSISVLVIFMVALYFNHSTTANDISCSEEFYQLFAEKKNMPFCKKLSTLEAEFGWKISEQNERQIDIVFGTKLNADMGWLAWGVNPNNRPQMVGTRAMIGINQINGSLDIYTYNITRETKLGCKIQPSLIDVEFRNMTIVHSALTDYYSIQATVILPPVYNILRLSHVWQVGYKVEGKEPKMHPTTLQNVDSAETINLKNGLSQQVQPHRNYLRLVHGIVNIVGWGTVLPTGAIIARYCRYPLEINERLWYYLHISCQIVGYILGTVGWAFGLYLGHASRYYTFNTHRLYGIFIFTFTTLQVLALRLRPEKNDEYRKYWNMYHHILGYALLAVISINIFLGIDILKPDNNVWKWSYIGVLAAFAVIVVAFEIYTWIKFTKDKKKAPPGPNQPQGSSEPSSSTTSAQDT